MAAKKIVVKQSTIDQIKKLGMTAALKKAGKSGNAEYIEGVRRMYGQRRLSAAMKSSPVAKSADAARAAAMRKKAPVAKTADEARARAMGTSRATAKKAAAKKVNWRKEGLLPALKSGAFKGKKISKGKVAGKGFFKS